MRNSTIFAAPAAVKTGLALAGLGIMASMLIWRINLSSAKPLDPTYQYPVYTEDGEALLHGYLADPGIGDHLPLVEIFPVLLNHRGLWKSWVLPAQMLQGVLTFSIGCLLSPFAGILPALALFLLTCCREGFAYNYPQSEFTLLVLAVAGFLVWRAQAPSWRRSLILALSIGGTLLFRSPLAFFPPLLALHEWLSSRRSGHSWWKQALILCIVPYLFLLPWIRRNWIADHSFVPFENGESVPNIATGALGLVGTVEGQWQSFVEGLPSERTGPVLAWSIQTVFRHPVRYMIGFAKRLEYAACLHPTLFFLALLALGIHKQRQDLRALALLAAYFLGIHCFIGVKEGYFTPLWPLLSLLGASLILPFSAQFKPRMDAIEYRFSENILKAFLVPVLALALYAIREVSVSANMLQLDLPARKQALDAALKSYPRDVWLLSERGERRLESGDLAGAVDDLAKASTLEPGNQARRLKLAWAKTLQGDPTDLLRWQGPPIIDQVTFRASIFKAIACFRLGRLEAAREHLKAALDQYDATVVIRIAQDEREPRLLEALRSRDRFLDILNELSQKLPLKLRMGIVKELTRLEPKEASFWLGRAEFAVLSRDPQESLRSLAEAQRLNPGRNGMRRIGALHARVKTEILVPAGEVRRRGALAKPSLGSAPGADAGPWLTLAEKAINARDRDSAKTALRKAEALKPDVGGLRNIARDYRRIEDNASALKIIRALIRQSPKDATLWVYQAEMAALIGDRGLALESLAQAKSGNPEADVLSRAAALYEKLEEYPLALESIDRMTRRVAHDAGLWVAKADISLRAGKADLALKSLAQAESLKPEKRDTWRRIALIYQDLGQYVPAAAILERLALKEPNDAAMLHDLAVCSYLGGSRQKAVALLKTALTLDPQLLVAYLTLGSIYTAQGSPEEALKIYDMALARGFAGDEGMRRQILDSRRDALSRAAKLKALK